MAKRYIISQFKCAEVTITYSCKEVVVGPFRCNHYDVEVYHHLSKHRERIYSGLYTIEAPARFALKVMEYLDRTTK